MTMKNRFHFMEVSNLYLYGKRTAICAAVLFLGFACTSFVLLSYYFENPQTGLLLAAGLFFLFALVLLTALLYFLAGKKNIICLNGGVSIKSLLILTKERTITIPAGSCLVLQCSESGRHEIHDIFHSRVRMAVEPIYYDIKIEQTGHLILRSATRQTALDALHYMAQKLSGITSRIELGDEANILELRRSLWLRIQKNALRALSVISAVLALIFGFCSYCIYVDVTGHDWKKHSVVVESATGDHELRVSLTSADGVQKYYQCSVMSSDMPILRSKLQQVTEVYLSFNNSPELRIRISTQKDYTIFGLFSGMAFIISISSMYFSHRAGRKLLSAQSPASSPNPGIPDIT